MRYLLILLLSVNLMFAQSQEEKKYQIKHNGKSLGVVTATKEVKANGVIVYTTKSIIDKRVLTIKKLDYNLVVEMKDGALVKSDYKLYVNGKLKSDSQLSYNNGVYTRYFEGKEMEQLNTPITYVSSMFLFQSPEGHEKTYSESKQKFRTIYKLDSSKYGLGKSKSNTDTEYTYQKEILQHVFIDEFVDFTMEPIN